MLLSWASLACGPESPDAPANRSRPVAYATPSPTPTLDPARPFGVDDPTVPLLAQKLSDPDRRVRWYAAGYLASRSAEAQPVVPALIAALGDEDEEVAATAAFALGRIGPPASPAGPALVTMLASARPGRRHAAAVALARIGTTPDAVPALIACSRAEDERTGARLAAFEALATLRPPSGEALQRLAEGMADDPKIRAVAAAALSGLGPELARVLDSLVLALEHPAPAARRSAVSLIARAGPAAAAAVPALYGALRDEDERVREEARRAIRAVRGQ